MTKIQIRRGLFSELPALLEGELGYATDTKQLFVGTSGGNEEITYTLDLSNVSQDIVLSGDFSQSNGQASAATNDLGTKSAGFAIDFADGNTQKVILGANVTISGFTNAEVGAFYTLVVTQDGTGSRTLTFPAGSKGVGGAIELSTDPNAIDMISIYIKGASEFLIAIANDFTAL